ncbi:helix-turn-helix domain-containing protein [uncultured Kocuria sp.]|uniref:helix-turn-helix domain-containing protein n=1 Tax=uncultured Kocuria sp. TaxID=259305 RepID=UPI00259746B9|nr:helix-turn-helix domain-containing protein [uncultured Kocuria sp.]
MVTYSLVAQAQKITRLTAAQKVVLMHLCQVANEECDWKVWHSQAQIAIWNGLGERTVRDALAKLTELKLVSTGSFAGEMMGRNVYQVDRKRVRLMAETDRHEADEKIRESRLKGREHKAQQRIRRQMRRSLRVVPVPVENLGEGGMMSRRKLPGQPAKSAGTSRRKLPGLSRQILPPLTIRRNY